MSNQPSSQESLATPLNWIALLLAAVATAGSLYLSMGMSLVACPLCFYQRSFAMAALAVLLVGIGTGMGRVVSLSALALPLAAAGLGVAGFHVWLELSGVLECPKALFDLGTAPQQSLAALGLLTVALLLDAGSRRIGSSWLAAVAGLVLGGLMAAGSIASAPPLPKLPDKPYDSPPKICRPPFVAQK
jgi:disulfide bond formation protein DsbB